MKVYCINLDRHSQRMARMNECLKGLPFERIAGVDGANCSGPERRDVSILATPATLTKYERACLASHRLAWARLLADSLPFGCVLEDDVILSPDFSSFVDNTEWIPVGCEIVKLETFLEPVTLSRATRPARGRRLAEIRSLHYGSAAYLLSRHAAERLLAATVAPALPVDAVLFYPERSKVNGPTWQLDPALCVQAQRQPGAVTFEELQSCIQPPRFKKKKTARQRFIAEASRPFRQLAAGVGRWWFQQHTRSERRVVPHV
jgi:glycosyl transferase family 25